MYLSVPDDGFQHFGFAFAVGADQTDMLAAQQAEGNVLENGAVAKAVGQVFDI